MGGDILPKDGEPFGVALGQLVGVEDALFKTTPGACLP